jgi:hypothetical protein
VVGDLMLIIMNATINKVKLRTELGEASVKVGAGILAATIFGIFIKNVSALASLGCLLFAVTFIAMGVWFKSKNN